MGGERIGTVEQGVDGEVLDGLTRELEEPRRRLILRHCERSEAIQNLSAEAVWIASSQVLLATAW